MPFTIPGASIGQINRTGDPNANFAKLFAVNIINAYENACVLKGLPMNQDVDGGDQYNYPIEGEAAAGLATTVNGPMGQIEIEATNRAHVPIKMDDEYDCNIALTKRELKAALNDSIERINKAEKIGSAVGRMKDYILHLCLAKGASTIADGDKANVRVSGMDSGTLIDIKSKASADEITGAELQKAVYVLGATYRRKNVPMGDRYLLIDPIEQSKVAQQPMLLDRDYGATGTVKSGTVPRFAGFDILESNVIPSANIIGTTPIKGSPFSIGSERKQTYAEFANDYTVDATGFIALATSPLALRTCTWDKLMVRASGNWDVDLLTRKWYASAVLRMGANYSMEAACGAIKFSA